jgi:hypothetical protein
MKLRIGFVSNSSSTSFVVAVDPLHMGDAVISVTLEIPVVDLRDSDETTFKTYKEFYDWLFSDYWSDEMDEQKRKSFEREYDEQLDSAKNAFANGKILLRCNAATDNGNEIESAIASVGTEQVEVYGCEIIVHGDSF